VKAADLQLKQAAAESSGMAKAKYHEN